jgi:hypothetical protein
VRLPLLLVKLRCCWHTAAMLWMDSACTHTRTKLGRTASCFVLVADCAADTRLVLMLMQQVVLLMAMLLLVIRAMLMCCSVVTHAELGIAFAQLAVMLMDSAC